MKATLWGRDNCVWVSVVLEVVVVAQQVAFAAKVAVVAKVIMPAMKRPPDHVMTFQNRGSSRMNYKDEQTNQSR